MRFLVDFEDLRAAKKKQFLLVFVFAPILFFCMVYILGNFNIFSEMLIHVESIRIFESKVLSIKEINPNQVSYFSGSVLITPIYVLICSSAFIHFGKFSFWEIPKNARERVRPSIIFFLISLASLFLVFILPLHGASGELLKLHVFLIWPLFNLLNIFLILCLSFGVFQIFGYILLGIGDGNE